MHWHPTTGLLLTCSTDRGIIVWNQGSKGDLMPQLVNIKELKSNLDA
jgi:hypothetical protein